jgi:hypothetical protein
MLVCTCLVCRYAHAVYPRVWEVIICTLSKQGTARTEGIQKCTLVGETIRNKNPKVCFFSMEWNSESFFLFWGVVQNKVPRVSFYFCSSVRNSEHFLFRGMVQNRIPRVFCSSEPQEFHGNKPFFCLFCLPWIFLSEIPNPKCKYSKKVGVSKTNLLIEGLVGETVTCPITIKRRDRF